MIAAYYRLSQADEIANEKDESNSIINQRNMIRSYISEHTDLALMLLREFTDDGFSGTSTNRPAFQKMLNGIKSGEITCVIVKDFSRFARNYIEAGDYIERIFPFLGVRFIAVTDGYDSDDLCNADSKNTEMVIKNVINAAYSKDLSAKICASNQVKRSRQEYLGGLRPYGFLPDPYDHHKLIVDPVASKYVKRIFELAVEGYSLLHIASILHNEGIPTPSSYMVETGAVKKITKSWKKGGDQWDAQKVRYILRNEKYKGTFVAQKNIQSAPCSKYIVRNTPELIVAVENAHVAIVTPEMFETAQQVIKKSTSQTKRTKRSYPLKGKAICGGCGRNMVWDERYGKYGTYRCRNISVDKHFDCVKDRILTEDLLNAICKAFWSRYDIFKAAEETVKFKEKEFLRQKSTLEKRQTKLEEQKRLLTVRKIGTYEDFAEGRLKRADFLICKQKFEEEHNDIESAVREVSSALDSLIKQGKPNAERLKRVIALSSKNEHKALFGIALDEFVEQVIVYDKNRIEIVWNFADEIAEALREEV